MKNVLVIGAGRGQIPIMELCHNSGCYVSAVSPHGNYPGLDVADEVFFSDVRDYNKILGYAKSHHVDAVLTDQLDVGVYTAAYIAENMHLPGITTSVARRFTNKYYMREAARQAGINVPKCMVIENIDNIGDVIKELSFPMMMKPVDSDASRGVYKVHSFDDIVEHFESSLSYSKSKSVILEEFVDGVEYVVEAYTSGYKPYNLVVGHREYFQIPETFIPNATVFHDAESATSPLENRLKMINKELVIALGLPFGITHAEYLYSELEDKIYLVEIAARGGGVFISSDLVPLSCGINANELLVKDALGLPNEFPITIKQGAAAYFCYLAPEGTVVELNHLDEIAKIPGVYRAYFDNIEIGMKTGSIIDKSSRKGPILVYGKTKNQCYSVISSVKSELDIRVKTNKGIENVIWH